MAGNLGQANVTAEIGGPHSANPGNWLGVVTQQDIGIGLPEFECYRIVIDGGPPGSTFTIMIGARKWDSVYPGNDTSWDPNQPMPLIQSDKINFLWNTGAGDSAPDIWMYFRERAVLR